MIWIVLTASRGFKNKQWKSLAEVEWCTLKLPDPRNHANAVDCALVEHKHVPLNIPVNASSLATGMVQPFTRFALLKPVRAGIFAPVPGKVYGLQFT